MSSRARFHLYVKAGKDGKCIGDCPFSQRVNMYASLSVENNQVEIIPVNTIDKPEYFLKLNPEGKVPVLVDTQNYNKVIADSSEITRYLNEKFPRPELKQGYSGSASEATAGIFPKFVAMMKNKDSSNEQTVKEDLRVELKKLNDYLDQKDSEDDFLLCDNICELDCQILPKLRHVQVAGKHYKSFEIPTEFTALLKYIKAGESDEVFKKTCPNDEEIIWGWSKFFTV